MKIIPEKDNDAENRSEECEFQVSTRVLSHKPNQNFGQGSRSKRDLELSLSLSDDIQVNSNTLSFQLSVMAAGNIDHREAKTAHRDTMAPGSVS